MIHKLFASLLAASSLFGTSAIADTAKAYCAVSPHDHTIPIKTGDCIFSQYQGTIHVSMDGQTYSYASDEVDITYQRDNRDEGIWLHNDNRTVVVLWEDPEIACEG